MSRFEGQFVADGQAAGHDLATLLDRLNQINGSVSDSDRRQAIVCLLSASDGWREASLRLSGNFADDNSGTASESRIGREE